MSAEAVAPREGVTGPLEQFRYDDKIVRAFTLATVVWGIVGMLVGVIVALQLAKPELNLGISWLTFGRLRPLHTNAVIFAFAGNAVFAAVYYSSQRLLKARMFSDLLSRFHFWGWQAIIVSAAITLPLGISQGKEYAELEWPIDIAVAVVWVAFAINFFGTVARRRERHLYVALWFYIATIITIAVLHIFNNLVLPVSALKSYPIYAGVQDAFMQWWYGHNAVGFLLTTPFLGLMYYFLPKAANRPVFSYKLSILHFWSLVFIYIWAGPHHLHYTALPAWASTLGMLFSVMLWMPSWGGMLNGLLTLRGAWHKVAEDPILKFFVVAVTFYGMSTFEGPMLSVKSVNALSHYTDWTIAHVHAGALGWVRFMTYGMVYWLMPRLFQTELWSRKLMTTHFWIGTVGILLYIIPIYAAGLTQGLMWRAFDASGILRYTDFVTTVNTLMPFYWMRAIGGTLYLVGAAACLVNLAMTWVRRPASYEQPLQQAPALARTYADQPLPPPRVANVANVGKVLDVFAQMRWHRHWERLPIRFSVWVTIAVVSASLFEIIPTFVIKSNVPTIATVQPYTPLELAGRDIYVAEGCYNCHSQMVRPMRHEIERYGDYSKAGEFVYDRPFQWGSRRIGPDLHRIGQTNTSVSWHVRHFNRPTDTSKGSIMPRYQWLLEERLDFSAIPPKVATMRKLGVPYTEADVEQAEQNARDQAEQIYRKLIAEDGTYEGSHLQDKKVTALIAYLLRLGTDITKPPPEEPISPTMEAVATH
ncbi:MAG: cytochrome-c oxidase, cbb3-type subunit I [Acidobacteriota bacterium]|nr:MAG: cytochrome-c oxidase, cbb3-type subunit I [Acidobacteriota bacterium]